MKKQKIISLIGIMLVACSDPVFDQKHSSLEGLLRVQLEQYVNGSSNVSAGWLLVDLPDEQISLTSGVSSIEEMQELHVDVLFRTASVTKMITSAVIMQLTEEGLLDLSDYVSVHLDESLVKGIQRGESSIKDLLQHTSGIDDYVQLNWVETLQGDPSRFWKPEELIAYVKEYGAPKFNPGEDYYYSDTNYVLLGLIIEKVTGKDLMQNYHERILLPLGMGNTYLEAYSTEENLEIATGYFELFNLSDWNTSSDWGSGGLVSTIGDLSIFMKGLKNGVLFQKEETFQSMQQWIAINDRASYGFGIGRYKIRNSNLIGHGGLGFGFTCGVYWYPEKEAIIVWAVNQQASSIDDFEQSVVDAINQFY